MTKRLWPYYGLLIAVTVLWGVLVGPAPAEALQGYRLQPDDVVRIEVAEHEDLRRIITVESNGLIQYPPVGTVTAAGMTTSQLAGALQDKLVDELDTRPEVEVTIEAYGNPQVLILGEVNNPGEYRLPHSSMRLLTLISLAGGPTGKADMREVTLTRGDQVRYVDCIRIEEGLDSDANVVLQPEDVIYVPRSLQLVEVRGEVKQPGAFHVEGSKSLTEILAKAEGPTQRADISNIQILRGGEEKEVVDLQAKLAELDSADQLPAVMDLRPGDVMHVPAVEGSGSSWTLERLRFLQEILARFW